MAKSYRYKNEEFPKRTDFMDGSSMITCDDGSIIVTEAQKPYGIRKYLYQFDDFKIGLN